MNKVIIINLDGIAYQLEEGGYEALRAYLDTAAARLEGNPDRDEILSDIERALGEKFRAVLGSQKNVVATKEVTAALSAMGPVEAEPGEGAKAGGTGAGGQSATSGGGTGANEGQRATPGGGAPRRLYRIREGAMFAGVCNGIAAYFNNDATFVRVCFVVGTFFGGLGLIIYLVLAVVLPQAESAEEKAAACGNAATAQEFIRRAKEGYYEAMKGFPDRAARRAWKRQFKREMRANAAQWRYNWHSQWAASGPLHPGMGFAVPVISMVHGVMVVLWVCALISLLTTNAVFGVALPASMPVWAAALLLCMMYGVLAGLLKAARRDCYLGLGRPNWTWSIVFLLDAGVQVAVAIALVWLGIHYFPEIREAVRGVPALAHQATNDIQIWWKTK